MIKIPRLKLVAGGALTSLVLGLFFVSGVLGYGTVKSHPHLTKEAAIFYNHFEPQNQLSSEEIGWLVLGAIEEDAMPRYTNHFYDPVYSRGWNGNLTAKDWAQSSEKQSTSIKGDQSWEQAIYKYREGNKKEAFIALGHTLHLIEDMAVPEHTRNDTHLPFDSMESPYEKWVEEYLGKNYEPYANQLISDNKNLLNISTLNSAFDELAKFSNENFFSEDSILSSGYNSPPIDGYELINGNWFGIGSINGQKYKLFMIVKNGNLRNLKDISNFSIKDKDSLILSDYLSILGPKAVQYGASVIDLFFRQIETEEKSGTENNKPKSAWDAFRDKVAEVLNIPQLASRSQADKVKSASETTLESGTNPANRIPDVIVLSGPIGAVDSADESPSVSLRDISRRETGDLPQGDNISDESNRSNQSDKTDKPELLLPILFAPQIPPSISVPPPPTPPPAPVPVYYGGQWSLTPTGASVGTNAASPANETTEVEPPAEVQPPNNQTEEPPPTPPPDLSSEALAEEDTTPPLVPQIVLPTNSSEYLTNQSQINFSGTMSTDTARIKIVLIPSLTLPLAEGEGWGGGGCEEFNLLSFDEPQKWSKDFNFSQKDDGEYLFDVFAYDEAGNISPTSSLKISIDRTPPEILEFKVSKNKNNDFELGWTLTPSLPLAEGEGREGEGGDTYDLEYSLNNGEFLLIFESATSTSFVFEPNPKKHKDKYKFRLRAKDEAGNISDWQETQEEIKLPHIVISEIKISGANTGETNDEFVELYNPNSAAVSLSDWKLRPFSASGKEKSYLLRPFSENATIPPFGFYLITHPEGYKHNITPDAVYSTKESLASNNGLVLYSSDEEIIDLVGWGELSTSTLYETAPAPDISKGFSIERKAKINSTQETMSVGGEDEFLGNGFDTDNNSADFILRPNPEPQNSESLSEPREGEFAVPGVIADLKIIWPKTTNLSIAFYFSAPKNANFGETSKYDLRYEETSVPGVCLLNINWAQAASAEAETAPNSNEGAREEIIVLGLEEGKEYCFAVKTWNGLAWSAVSNTTIAATSKEYKKDGSILKHVTYIPPNIVDEYTLTPEQNPYYVASRVDVKQGGKLKIMPGVVIKFGPPYWEASYMRPTEILVRGSLEILGTEDNPIIFTSFKDDRFYGDTNGDGSGSSPAIDNWGGIRNSPESTLPSPHITISHAKVYYSGGGLNFVVSGSYCQKSQKVILDHVYLAYNYQALTHTHLQGVCEDKIIEINNSLIENNKAGFWLKDRGMAKIRNSTFRNNSSWGIYLEAVFSNQLDISQSNIYGNGSYDLQNFCGSSLKTMMGIALCYEKGGWPKQISATSVWWGSADGPQKVTRPNGTTYLKVGDKVDYSGWLTEEADIDMKGDND